MAHSATRMAIGAGAAVLSGCASGRPRESRRPSVRLTPRPAARTGFEDVTARSGIKFVHSNGGSGHRYYLETTGAGCAFLDYDNDGWLDIFAVQSGPLPLPGVTNNARNVLYRNNKDGTFTDVTEEAGLAAPCGYGQGVAVGDYDNDGYKDILVTTYGGVHLFHNNGRGRFTDVTEQAGLFRQTAIPIWATCAAWADFDNDGLLDLFVCHYVNWTPKTDQDCPQPDGSRRGFCPPQVYDPQTCALYRNNGDGTFTDISEKSGISKVPAKALGVACFDYDGDGRTDILVANDGIPNVLFRNNGDGTFTNVAAAAGVAYGENGNTYNGMGIAVGDFRRTGHNDLVIGNFAGQPKSVYFNNGKGYFADATYTSHVGNTSLVRLGFGCAALDYDLDGWLDFVVANGHISDLAPKYGVGLSYKQASQLFHNNRDGTFTEDLAAEGDLSVPAVGRGLAVGDFDNDGAPDILISHSNGPMGLYRNRSAQGHSWITIRLEGTRSNRDGVGAKVWVTAGGATQFAERVGGSSYCSASSERLQFGLASAKRVDSVRVRWPDGHSESFGPLYVNKFYTVREGVGASVDPRCHSVNPTESVGARVES